MAALEHIGSGKVREIFRIDDERLLIVASDRISAFDVVLEEDIPHKGQVLTGVSLHWFDILDTPHHLISADTWEMDFLDEQQQVAYAGRAMLVRAAEVIPMECVIRGYLYGSSWKEYAAGGGPTTEHLPDGLEMASKLPEPIFTPATKAESGHDENLTEAEAREFVGNDLYEDLKARSLAIYNAGAEYAAKRGIILADTKFEFGRGRRRDHPHRRSADPGQLPLLAGGCVGAGSRDALLRQATRPGLARGAGRMGQDSAGTADAARGRH